MDTSLRLSGIIEESISNGPGIRMVVFAQGCPHHCKGCHNPQTHDPQGGYETTIGEVLKLIDANPLLDGITLSGGEPFEQAHAFSQLAKAVKERNLSVVTYTGYTFETLNRVAQPAWQALLQETDLLIDGPFVEPLKNGLLKFRGSENQRMIDVHASMAASEIIIATV